MNDKEFQAFEQRIRSIQAYAMGENITPAANYDRVNKELVITIGNSIIPPFTTPVHNQQDTDITRAVLDRIMPNAVITFNDSVQKDVQREIMIGSKSINGSALIGSSVSATHQDVIQAAKTDDGQSEGKKNPLKDVDMKKLQEFLKKKEEGAAIATKPDVRAEEFLPRVEPGNVGGLGDNKTDKNEIGKNENGQTVPGSNKTTFQYNPVANKIMSQKPLDEIAKEVLEGFKKTSEGKDIQKANIRISSGKLDIEYLAEGAAIGKTVQHILSSSDTLRYKAIADAAKMALIGEGLEIGSIGLPSTTWNKDKKS